MLVSHLLAPLKKQKQKTQDGTNISKRPQAFKYLICVNNSMSSNVLLF